MQLFRRKREHPLARLARGPGGLGLLAGLGTGVALLYFFDRGNGKRRRELVAEKAGRYSRQASGKLSRRARDLRNRARGAVAEARGRLVSDHPDDDVLVARVRSQLGHHVDRAGAIDTEANDGIVTLRGSILAAELGEVLSEVRGVRGVRDVVNELAVYEHAAEMP